MTLNRIRVGYPKWLTDCDLRVAACEDDRPCSPTFDAERPIRRHRLRSRVPVAPCPRLL